MKAIETGLYGALLALTAGLAWTGWKADDKPVEEDVVVFTPGDIQRVVWHDDASEATIEVVGKGKDARVWVTAGKAEGKAGDDDDSAEPQARGPIALRRFPGNEQALSLVQEKLSPLRALRQFSGVDDAQAEQMGLTTPEATLRVEGSAGTVDLSVGAKAYGSSDTYVRKSDGAVWLLSSKVLGPLRAADTRLMDRALIAGDALEIAQATVRGAGGEVAAVHQATHDKDNAYWARPGAADAKDTALDAFFEKFFQLRASSYPVQGAEAGAVEELLTVALSPAAGAPQSVAIGRRANAERSKPGEPVWDWLARSAHTGDQWVELPRSSASDLAEALPGLLEG